MTSAWHKGLANSARIVQARAVQARAVQATAEAGICPEAGQTEELQGLWESLGLSQRAQRGEHQTLAAQPVAVPNMSRVRANRHASASGAEISFGMAVSPLWPRRPSPVLLHLDLARLEILPDFVTVSTVATGGPVADAVMT